jgi:hypothetical protein
MASNPGRRVPIDLAGGLNPDSGLTAGSPGQDDLAKGLKPSNIYSDPTVPVYESPGLQNKNALGSK